MTVVTRTDAFTDPNLFGHFFDPIDTWAAHVVIIRALDGLPLDAGQQKIFSRLTERDYDPALAMALVTILLLMGRRSGKSVLTAFLAAFEAYFVDHSGHLKPGESGTVQVVATDRKQARIILRYLEALFDNSPILCQAIVRRKAEAIELDNGIVIQVASCTIRAVRGYTCVAVIAEEAAFWRSDESSNPDRDVINALMATMATIPTGKCFILTSPYADYGHVAQLYKDHFGEDSANTLVFQAPTWVMNPTIQTSFLEAEEARDPESFNSEYGAQFRTDRAAALERVWVDNALSLPNLDRPRSEHTRPYRAFVDMSGGRSDSAALAIAHMEPDGDEVIVSCVRRWVPPFSPESVAEQMAEIVKSYGQHSVIGDNYSAELIVELFSKAGIGYQRSDLTASDIYLQAIPLFATGKIEAPNNAVLRRELSMLERRTRVSGKDLITHPTGGSHDDMANATCGAIVNAWRSRAMQGLTFIVKESDYLRDGPSLTDDVGPNPWSFL